MGLILPQEVEVCIAINFKHYIEKGYKIPTKTSHDGTVQYSRNTPVYVNVLDLPRRSNVQVKCTCDYCGKEFMRQYGAINKILHSSNPKISCEAKLCCNYKKSETLTGRMKQSFSEWCIMHERNDLLDRWDYQRNKCTPNDISAADCTGYWFYCQRGLHESEEYAPCVLTSPNKNKLTGECRKCGSFAQLLIDCYGDHAIQKYWDYSKNTVDPWTLRASSRRKVWIKCVHTDYHGSFDTYTYNIKNGYGCPYCKHRRVHPKDSFAQSLINTYGDDALDKIWDEDKNTVDPWSIPPSGLARVWIKCLEHRDHPSYCLSTNDFSNKFLGCPMCTSSAGERRIAIYLQKRHIEYLREYRDPRCRDRFALPFDFYIPSMNTMIEFQGIQHYQPVDFSGHGKYDFEQAFKKQKEHDAIKQKFCDDHGYNLIAIPYTEMDHLTGYLDNYLSSISNEQQLRKLN